MIRRRAGQFVLPGLVFLAALALDPAFVVAQQKQVEPEIWRKLVSFENQDLAKLDNRQREELAQLLESILAKSKKQSFGFGPYCLARIASQGNARLVLVECQPLMIIPGLSEARVSVFDTEGRLLNSVEFQTGWRITIEGARILQTSPLHVPLVEILSRNVINGRDVARQFYGLVDDDVVLVRLENSEGEIVPNEYDSSNQTIGPTASDRSLSDWENSLMSDNPVDVLRTLVWLGSRHWELEERPSSTKELTPEADARNVNNVRSIERIQNKLKVLIGSDNQWIREAAEFASRQ
jgi:hypothetical protein